MKKVIAALALLLFFNTAAALPEIPDGFYLENGNILDDSKPVVNVLPNTLRVILTAGEEEEIYAETLPENSKGSISWSISNGSIAELYPMGAKCTVRGVRAGSAYIRVCAENGAPRLLAVEVTESPQIASRSFEYVGEAAPEPAFTDKTMSCILWFLAVAGASLLVASLGLIVRRKRKSEKG